jgi:hypothetical protein
VVLNNGDRITGEVKNLERGILSYKTDAIGTLKIEWENVAQLRSEQLLQIKATGDPRQLGRVPELGPKGTLALRVDGQTEPVNITLAEIVHMEPLAEGSLPERLDGYVSFGLNAASANDTRSATLGANVDYRDAKRSWEIDYSAARSESSGNPSSNRQSLQLQHWRFVGEHWFWAGAASLTSNDQLDLDLRALVGGGFGRFLVRETDQELAVLGGLVATEERLADGSRQSSLEGLVQGRYGLFRFNDPEVDISLGLLLYPSLSVSGRLRAEATANARYEIVKDLYYDLSYIQSYDSDPQSTDASKTDWSVVTSIGYKF